MTKPTNAEQIFDAANRSTLSARNALWAALKMSDPAVATRVLALNVPDVVCGVILRDRRLTKDAEIESTFNDAHEISSIYNHARGSPLPDGFGMNSFITSDAFGRKSLMPLADARRKLQNALAFMDQHIDTARPADPLAASFVAMGEKRYAKSASTQKAQGGKA